MDQNRQLLSTAILVNAGLSAPDVAAVDPLDTALSGEGARMSSSMAGSKIKRITPAIYSAAVSNP